VGLTLSVGHWADEKDADGRNWIQVEIVRELAEVKMKLADPAESSLFPWEPGGTPLGEQLREMLLHQAFSQVEQFTGRPAPREQMAAAQEVQRELKSSNQE